MSYFVLMCYGHSISSPSLTLPTNTSDVCRDRPIHHRQIHPVSYIFSRVKTPQPPGFTPLAGLTYSPKTLMKPLPRVYPCTLLALHWIVIRSLRPLQFTLHTDDTVRVLRSVEKRNFEGGFSTVNTYTDTHEPF